MPDRYMMSARIMPALVVLAPIGAVLAGLALAKPLTFAGVPLVAALSFLLGDIVRGAGQRAQDRLWTAWGGPPTTRRLRWRELSDPEVMAQRHRDVSAATGADLPTAEAERSDSELADTQYEHAVERLIDLVAAKPLEHPHVTHELTTYGFRRNLYGCKRAGITTCVVGVASAAAIVMFRDGELGDRLTAAAIPALVSLGLLVTWLVLVRQAWVRKAAEDYADRLWRAAAHIARTPQSS